MTRGPDGRWARSTPGAIRQRYPYQAQARPACPPPRRRVEPIRRGQAEIAGIPQPVLRALSRRRAVVEEQMTERGEGSSRAAHVAALDSPQAKDYPARPRARDRLAP
jgi:hypothetical protein